MNVCLDKCAPLVTRQILRPPAPWISEEIKSKIRERNQLQKNLKVDRKNTAQRKLLIDTKRKDYYKNELQKSKDISSTWKIAKNMLNNDSHRKH